VTAFGRKPGKSPIISQGDFIVDNRRRRCEPGFFRGRSQIDSRAVDCKKQIGDVFAGDLFRRRVEFGFGESAVFVRVDCLRLLEVGISAISRTVRSLTRDGSISIREMVETEISERVRRRENGK
jgi:hypothetical protein